MCSGEAGTRLSARFISSLKENLVCSVWVELTRGPHPAECGAVGFGFVRSCINVLALFAHSPTEHHFGSSGMTLNERFTKYLKKGMEQDAAKNKKSPEIHRLVP